MGLFDSFNPLAAVGNVVGSLIQSKTAKGIARDQMDFQYDMAKSSHQIEAQDLEAAGLNRILTATGGSGAAVPAGASAPTPENIVGGAINQGFAAKQKALEQEAIEASIEKTKQDTQTSKAVMNTTDNQGVLNMVLAEKAKADTQLTLNSAQNAIITNRLLQNQLPGSSNWASVGKGLQPWLEKIGSIWRELGGMASSAYDVVTTPKK